jgi:hypothetical protein
MFVRANSPEARKPVLGRNSIRRAIWRLGTSPQTPNGTSEQLTHSGDIEWYDTPEECKARAERILHNHQTRVY